jgi:hypothetical protein
VLMVPSGISADVEDSSQRCHELTPGPLAADPSLLGGSTAPGGSMLTLRRSVRLAMGLLLGVRARPRTVSPSRLDAPVREGRAVARSVAGPFRMHSPWVRDNPVRPCVTDDLRAGCGGATTAPGCDIYPSRARGLLRVDSYPCAAGSATTPDEVRPPWTRGFGERREHRTFPRSSRLL